MLSIIAPPDFNKNADTTLLAPHPDGSSQYPIPINIPATGSAATGSIKDLPNF